jgi:hypothetical protein
MISLLITVVISNPYQNIDYNAINSYEIENSYLTDVIHVTESENISESEIENKNQDEYCEIKEKEKDYQIELNRLYPYIFPFNYK